MPPENVDALVDDATDPANHKCDCAKSILLQAQVYELEARLRDVEYMLKNTLEHLNGSMG